MFAEAAEDAKASFTEEEQECYRVRRKITSSFLRGTQTTYHVSDILHLWWHDARGAGEEFCSDMFSGPSKSYTDIHPVRPAMSSFAYQIVLRELCVQAKRSTDPQSGLHVCLPTDRTARAKHVPLAQWSDFGITTHAKTQKVFQTYEPLLWGILTAVSTTAIRKSATVVALRSRRPIEPVITSVMSELAFLRNREARLLPLARGLTYFACLASQDLFAIGSRVAHTPSYTSVLRALHGLSKQAAQETLALGRDPQRGGKITFDNTQVQSTKRDPRIGRQTFMNTGIAATFWEFPEGSDVSFLDLEDKRRRQRAHDRQTMTVEKIEAAIDWKHDDIVMSLQWLQVLCRYIPELEPFKRDVAMLYQTRGAKHIIPADPPSRPHPLATTSNDETKPAELADASLDFMAQTGQTVDSFFERLFPFGGDGKSFELMLLLKQYFQFHPNALERFETMQPMLEWWHAVWTLANQLWTDHHVSYSSLDPSTLGHSASKIKRTVPISAGKVDYHQATHLIFFILDMRMLDAIRSHLEVDDLFSHFKGLAASGQLPALEDLDQLSRTMHRIYTSKRAQGLVRARAVVQRHDWPESIPTGHPWNHPPIVVTMSEGPVLEQKALPDPSIFCGDDVLERALAFLRDGMRLREVTMAMAYGDVGRIWNVMKQCIMVYAGSTHQPYARYMLEVLCDIDFESSPGLADLLLSISVVNLSAIPGHSAAVDYVQEYFNRIYEAIVQHKGAEFGEKFIREGVSRNLHHFQRLKSEFSGGIGLAERSSRHSRPDSSTEVQVLLDEYKEQDLHRFRAGRDMGTGDAPNTYEQGFYVLGEGGKLAQWTKRMAYSRDVDVRPALPVPSAHHFAPSTAASASHPSTSLPVPVPDSDSDSEEDIPLFNALHRTETPRDNTMTFSCINDGTASSYDVDIEADAHALSNMMDLEMQEMGTGISPDDLVSDEEEEYVIECVDTSNVYQAEHGA
ncbi:hypothetical protein FISHEDRAFT_42409 [Fistulina hepatica ATCC 64428]|uniref:DUF6589 domain-containing protein n=1 Tax=Fistulina hepatica ATCC 64428 TaxID=1128425 RepID=A0A0D7AEU7_9AGAR|nr:hypothetical protein FISHEDRAFT_42409 [Fistulina hepatica ATCC 64428]